MHNNKDVHHSSTSFMDFTVCRIYYLKETNRNTSPQKTPSGKSCQLYTTTNAIYCAYQFVPKNVAKCGRAETCCYDIFKMFQLSVSLSLVSEETFCLFYLSLCCL